jgi:phage terminase large subunit GpA-like protein
MVKVLFPKLTLCEGGLETGAEGIKTKEEAEQFGGQAGVAYDINYHQAGDNVTNLNMDAFLANTKAIAHGVATYARSFSSVNFNDTVEDDGEDLKKRDVVRRRAVLPRGQTKKRGKMSQAKTIVRANRYRNEVWR